MEALTTVARQALETGGTYIASVEIWRGDILEASSSDGLKITGGQVTVDGTRKHRRALRSLTIVDEDADPDLRFLLSGRSGAQIRPYVRWAGDSVRYPLGVFRAERTSADEAGSAVQYNVSGFDRSWLVERAGFTDGIVSIPSGTSVVEAVSSIATAALGPIEVRGVDLGRTEARTSWRSGDDPWSGAISSILFGVGGEAFFDAYGRLIVRPVPEVSVLSAPDFTYDSSVAVFDAGTSESLSSWGNGVTVVGTAPWLLTSVSATVWDDNPSSPTYYLGPTGKFPVRVENASVGSVSAATVAARAELQKLKGGDASITWSQVPNPAHEAGDILDITRPALGVNQRVVLDEFAIPLRPGPSEGSARLLGVTLE